MGLDSVELLLAIEDEFGLDIADEDAEKMCTVGDIFEHLKQRLCIGNSSLCNSQRCFHRLRQAICDTYNVPRRAIRPDSKLIDLIPQAEIRAGWPYLQLYTYLKIPKNNRIRLFSKQRVSEALTIKELVSTVLTLNTEVFPPEADSEQEVWDRLVNVIHRQSAAPIAAIQKDAFITKDLGID